eukprot:scaffold86009_cov35-Attheya_sp.AAC.3
MKKDIVRLAVRRSIRFEIRSNLLTNFPAKIVYPTWYCKNPTAFIRRIINVVYCCTDHHESNRIIASDGRFDVRRRPPTADDPQRYTTCSLP